MQTREERAFVTWVLRLYPGADHTVSEEPVSSLRLLFRLHTQHPPHGGKDRRAPTMLGNNSREEAGERGVGLGFGDPTSLEIILLSGLTPGNKVPRAPQASGRSRLGARSAVGPRQRSGSITQGGQGSKVPFCPPRPTRARAPLGCALPPEPSVRPASRRVPGAMATHRP